jgi:hypothetical protein
LHYDRDFDTIARYTERPARWKCRSHSNIYSFGLAMRRVTATVLRRVVPCRRVDTD